MNGLIDRLKGNLNLIVADLTARTPAVEILHRNSAGNLVNSQGQTVSAYRTGMDGALVHLDAKGMLEHALKDKITKLRYVQGIDTNAVLVLESHNLTGPYKVTSYQPMKITDH